MCFAAIFCAMLLHNVPDFTMKSAVSTYSDSLIHAKRKKCKIFFVENKITELEKDDQ